MPSTASNPLAVTSAPPLIMALPPTVTLLARVIAPMLLSSSSLVTSNVPFRSVVPATVRVTVSPPVTSPVITKFSPTFRLERPATVTVPFSVVLPALSRSRLPSTASNPLAVTSAPPLMVALPLTVTLSAKVMALVPSITRSLVTSSVPSRSVVPATVRVMLSPPM